MIDHLLARNILWARRRETEDPGFFKRLAAQQAPRYLWIGCSDSRVPANVITDLDPGEVFVHRNVANQIDGQDPNAMAVLHFAVNVLKVQEIIVCGHYGCGGIIASQSLPTGDPVLDRWLTPISGMCPAPLRPDEDQTAFFNRLCEANVQRQVETLATLPVILDAWARGQSLALHGLVYAIHDGILHDLAISRTGPNTVSIAQFAMTGDDDMDEDHPSCCGCGGH